MTNRLKEKKMYIQTMKYVSRIGRIKFVGKHLKNMIQWLCGKITGHKASKTDWGYAGEDHADVWCRWCDKFGTIPLCDLEKRFPESRKQIYEHTGKDIRNSM